MHLIVVLTDYFGPEMLSALRLKFCAHLALASGSIVLLTGK